MKKFDIIIAGDCNVDLIFNDFSKLPDYGEEVLAEKFHFTLGSSAGITAAHLATLGARVAFIGAIGNDVFGQQFKSMLNKCGVCTDYIPIRNDARTGCTVVMSKDEDRANLTHAGAMATLSPDDIPMELVQNTPFFHMSNPYVLPHFRNILPEFYQNIKALDTITSLDPQWDVDEKWDTDLGKLLPQLDTFFPNHNELGLLLKGNNITLEELTQKCTNSILMTCGNKGVELIRDNNKTVFEGYLNENPVDCIGAGDAFTAGYLRAKIENRCDKEAIDLGCKNGALSTTFEGGNVSYTSRSDFNEKFESHFL